MTMAADWRTDEPPHGPNSPAIAPASDRRGLSEHGAVDRLAPQRSQLRAPASRGASSGASTSSGGDGLVAALLLLSCLSSYSF